MTNESGAAPCEGFKPITLEAIDDFEPIKIYDWYGGPLFATYEYDSKKVIVMAGKFSQETGVEEKVFYTDDESLAEYELGKLKLTDLFRRSAEMAGGYWLLRHGVYDEGRSVTNASCEFMTDV